MRAAKGTPLLDSGADILNTSVQYPAHLKFLLHANQHRSPRYLFHYTRGLKHPSHTPLSFNQDCHNAAGLCQRSHDAARTL